MGGTNWKNNRGRDTQKSFNFPGPELIESERTKSKRKLIDQEGEDTRIRRQRTLKHAVIARFAACLTGFVAGRRDTRVVTVNWIGRWAKPTAGEVKLNEELVRVYLNTASVCGASGLSVGLFLASEDHFGGGGRGGVVFWPCASARSLLLSLLSLSLRFSGKV